MILGVEIHEISLDELRAPGRPAPDRDPRLTPDEGSLCRERADPAAPAGARIAAKTALFRALGLPLPGAGSPPWVDAWIERAPDGRPALAWRGAVAERIRELGVRRVHVSLTHDDDRAAALVLLEG